MAEQISRELMLRVEQATVKLPRTMSRGVLVPGEFIVTAAHYIEHEDVKDIMRGGFYSESVETCAGRLKASPAFMDIISDVAVLEEPSGDLSSEREASDLSFSERSAYTQ